MNDKNLKRATPNEAREYGRKGGIASGQARKERKAIRETVAAILASPAFLNGKAIVNPATGEPLENMQEAMVLATLRQALKGSDKAAAKLVEWLGEANTPAGVTINVELGK